MAKSSVTNTSESANKSWVELCDELYDSGSSDSENKTDLKELSGNDLKVDFKVKTISCNVKETKKASDESQNENTPIKVTSESVYIKTEVGIEVEKEESPWRFSYATILKNSASKSNIEDSKQTPNKKTPLKQTIKTEVVESNENRPVKREIQQEFLQDDLSLSKTPNKQTPLKQTIKTELVECNENGPVKSVKREIQREFLQDDLSLSSHLDVFHMQSPIKLEPVDEEMGSPMKSDRVMRSSKKRLCTPKLSLNEDAVMPDDVLMPSPKKVTRLSSRRKREPGESPSTCKRSKNSSGFRNTPKCVVPVHVPPVELETDEQVLIRRQKQIDYGKNTVGYENYLQMVPKLKRQRKHPQTPPKHIKYSRRAWDGLIRQWRQQLHFWDPPSEGGGNIDDLDLSSMSETSSDTGSLQSTPRDSHKPHRSTRATRSNRSSECSSLAEDSGCSPLQDN